MTTGPRLPALIPHSLGTVPAELRGGVVAVGNFDGVHRGHAALLEETRRRAVARGVPAVVLTFEPHPRSFFRPAEPVFRLTPLLAKARLLRAVGMYGLIVANFDAAFAAKDAETFVRAVLVGDLRASEVVVGDNFHFGKDRGGNPTVLSNLGKQLGFGVTVFGRVAATDGIAISSSAIRDALAAGDIVTANQLLGYRWFVLGTVISGDRRGRELGFPTANLDLGADCRLPHAIYAVRVQVAGGGVYDGVASYGRRPTFAAGAPLLEVFLFDFSGDLYGKELAVAFAAWIRPELKFDGVEALIEAMNKDVRRAREVLAREDAGTVLDQALTAPG